MAYGTPNCLNCIGPHFLWLLHVFKRRGKKRAGQNKHTIYHDSGTGQGKCAGPEHQSARTVRAAHPDDPLSDGSDYIPTDVAALARKK